MADPFLIPIVLFLTIGGTVVAVTGIVSKNRRERVRLEAESGGDYRRLAEEAVTGQRELLAEVQRMNGTLKEIEKLLREVG